jgi:hypothetical protein
VWALSTLIASIVGLLSEMSALQSRPAIQVAPVVFVTQTLVPVVLAPLLLGERFSDTPFGGVPLTLSLALLIGGAVMLVRSPLLLALTAGERASEPSGSGRKPSEPRAPTILSSPVRDAAEPSASTIPRRRRAADARAASPVAEIRSAPSRAWHRRCGRAPAARPAPRGRR